MRAFLVGATVVLAGCSEPPGISLEIAADDASITTVELFVGEHCNGCPGGMRPPQLSPKAADLYLVADPRPWTATVEGGVAGIRLESDTDTDVPALVIVGFDANHTPVATRTLYNISIPANDAVLWRTTLLPASPLVDIDTAHPRPPAGTERIKIWQSPNQTLPSCVMVEHWEADRVTRDALLPDGDRDCDAVPMAQECARYTPNAVGIAATIDEASCLLPVATPKSICMLGGPPCTEAGITPGQECDYLDEDYCAPLQLCACAPADAACITSAIAQGVSSNTLSHLRCTLPVQPDGSICPDHDPAIAKLDAGAMVQGGSTKCKRIALHDPMSLRGGFSDHVQFGTGTFKLTSFDQPCEAAIEWSGMLPLNPGGGASYMFAELELDNGKHLVLPLVIEPGECARPPSCAAFRIEGGITTETMFECTAPAPSSASCQASDVCPGPVCGGTCCGAGEACVEGVCRCGPTSRCAADQICGGGVDPAGCGSFCCKGASCEI
ncbi:MAG: hypothetical protein HOV81_11655 [Kofleriaceae bacterium]|nr:hypothetical protein [Kofleriaceae bacterium]